MGARNPVQPVTPPSFPFGVEFQKSLMRLMCEDSSFAWHVAKMLSPEYFENEVLAWAFAVGQQYADKFGGMPSLQVMLDRTRTLDAKVRDYYRETLETVKAASLKEEPWLREQVIDFVRRNIFVKAYHQSRSLWNAGKTSETFDFMMEALEQIRQTSWEVPDREFFFAEVGRRQNDRWKEDIAGISVPTGFPTLDTVLDGGLSPGELGVWIAYSKHGKSTALLNHGVAATRLAWKRTAHFVFEGSRKMVANRYEAAFMDELYTNIKRGDISDEKYARYVSEYHHMKDLLVIQGFVDEWDYSVIDVHQALKDLKSTYGWDPEMVIVDYGDLLRGRERMYPNEREKQKAAFRDLKSLANRGYPVWTASQAQRPEKDAESRPHLLRSRQIADCFEKVRVADFLGSLNMTVEEKRNYQMCMYAELYRDNEADLPFMIRADLPKMILREEPGIVSVHGSARLATSAPGIQGVHPQQNQTLQPMTI